MNWFRFSIASLAVVVAGSGVAFAALRNPSDLWAAGLMTAAILMVGVAALGVVYRREGRRAFWAGFLLFNVGYLVLTLSPWFRDEVRPNLLTTKAIDALYPRLHPGAVQTVNWVTPVAASGAVDMYAASTALNASQPWTGQTVNATGQPVTIQPWTGQTINATGQPVTMTSVYWPVAMNPINAVPDESAAFHRIGHSLFALLAALGGGVLGRLFVATRARRERSRALSDEAVLTAPTG